MPPVPRFEFDGKTTPNRLVLEDLARRRQAAANLKAVRAAMVDADIEARRDFVELAAEAVRERAADLAHTLRLRGVPMDARVRLGGHAGEEAGKEIQGWWVHWVDGKYGLRDDQAPHPNDMTLEDRPFEAIFLAADDTVNTTSPDYGSRLMTVRPGRKKARVPGPAGKKVKTHPPETVFMTPSVLDRSYMPKVPGNPTGFTLNPGEISQRLSTNTPIVTGGLIPTEFDPGKTPHTWTGPGAYDWQAAPEIKVPNSAVMLGITRLEGIANQPQYLVNAPVVPPRPQQPLPPPPPQAPAY